MTYSDTCRDRQKTKKTEIHIDTEKAKDRRRFTQAYRETAIQRNIDLFRQGDSQICRETDRQTVRFKPTA